MVIGGPIGGGPIGGSSLDVESLTQPSASNFPTDHPPKRHPANTLKEALDLAASDGARAVLDRAGRIAAARGPERRARARDVFMASLAIGQETKADAHLSVRWLYDWLVEQAGPSKVDALISSYVPSSPISFDSGQIKITEHLQAVLSRAVEIAQHTVRRNKFDVRHVLSALVLRDSNYSNENVLAFIQDQLGVSIPPFIDVIIARIQQSSEKGENLSSWVEIKDNAPPSPYVGPLPDALPVVALSGFTSDVLGLGKRDPLGIASDVRAFARLVCLEQATPPLSICLFGEWGSGKSTFMERLQQEILKLTRKNALEGKKEVAPTAAEDDEPRFVKDVVQVRFNAWHFADANLWASLTAVFFDQLRRGGYDGGRDANYQALIGKVAEKVKSYEALALRAEKHVAEARRRTEAAQKALDTAEKQLAASDLALASKQLQDDLEEIRTANEVKLKEVGRRVYRDDLAKESRAFVAAVVEASSIPGKLELIGRALIGGGLSTWLGIGAVVLVATLGVGLQTADPTILATAIQRVIGWGGGTFAAIAAIWQAFKTVKPILDGAWTYAKAVEEAREKLTKEVQAKRDEAVKAATALADAEKALETAREPLLKYGEGISADSPSTILRYFLFEDDDVRDYDKQVGIVSRARRSFEQLDAIVAFTRRGRWLAHKAGRGEPLTAEEEMLFERWRKLPSETAELRVPDRIVLYVDDLDRCTHDQVYNVLQAIHLLLAFELFVVVVGVDVRWIEGAVAKHFEAEALADRQAAETEKWALARRKRAIDYLEKIFQIPFWLERLSTEDEVDPPEGGTYGRYVRELLRENAEAKGGFKIFKTARTPSIELRSNLDTTTPLETAESSETPASERDEFEAVDSALASMRLEKAEIDFLASPEIGMVASKSPRAVKRLVNIYRIVRARLSDAELRYFLGEDGMPPLYPIAALLAAVEVGQPAEVADALYAGLKLLPDDKNLDAQWTVRRPTKSETQEADKHLDEVKRLAPQVVSAAHKVKRLCGPNGATVAEYRKVARNVRRYSFNRYD